MNAFDSFLLGKTMAESNQALGSMFASQQAAADRRADREISDVMNQLSNSAQVSNKNAWRFSAEKKATIALLKSVLKNGGVISEQSWIEFYAAYNAVRIQEPKHFEDGLAKIFADKLYEQLK